MNASVRSKNTAAEASSVPPSTDQLWYRRWYAEAAGEFKANHGLYWSHLGHLNNLLAILNISLFFMTGLIAQGYYFTYISLSAIILVALITLLPLPCARRLGFYLGCLALEGIALYLLVASAIHWVQMGGQL
ncbi:hypothetical protein DV711_00880 [Motiliproteus coralliicola]|uniref:Uncharacterized protein n=1 Tax=Motiliproteus coralliicola TaxID=2283196 RepID=A0A369WUF0_9GAMM|nr:hypothetical protein [Motiliproteus coralliicola]RDE24184.1 hypothetical protein DV711_00880 [Motiliproteus coralliicola]